MQVIWVRSETENFLRGDWTAQITLIALAFLAFAARQRSKQPVHRIGANVHPNADVTDDATDRGVALTLQAQEPINNHYQLWDFVPPTGGAANTVFIQNPQTGYVMELQSQSSAECPIVVNPRRISNESYQL